jgi:peptidoglycan/LPS O-acetylase OafA/YrhL
MDTLRSLSQQESSFHNDAASPSIGRLGSKTAKPMARRAEIDGLRAMAVLPVLIVHAGFRWLPGGFLGVDIFFVISGYLITGILRREIADDRFSMLQFYERRARRILPALFVVLMAATITAPFVMLSQDFKHFGQSLFAVNVFMSNMLFAREGGYFDAPSEFKPLLHTWSLGVEEQFYILFPAILFIVLRYTKLNPTRTLLWLAALSLVFAQYGLHRFSDANFFLLPSRAWELLFGGALALFQMDRVLAYKKYPGSFQILSCLGMAAIFAALLGATHDFPSPGIGASLVVAGVGLVLTCAVPGTLSHSLLSARLLGGIGLISYSAYLWHQPLFVFAHLYLGEISVWQWWTLIAVTMALAWLSWYFVENPFRDRTRFSRHTIFGLAAAGMAFYATVGLSIHVLRGAPQRFAGPAKLIDDGANDISPLRDTCGNRMPARFEDYCIFGRPDGPIAAVVGDSHGKELFWQMSVQLGSRPYALQPFLWNACAPFSFVHTDSADRCNEFHRAMQRYILQNRRIETVVIAANWPLYFNCTEGCPVSDVSAGQDGAADRIEGMSAAMAAEIDRYRAAGKAVVLVYPVPEMPWNTPYYMYSRWLRGLSFADIGQQRALHDARSALADTFLDLQVKKPGVTFVDPADLLCVGNNGKLCEAEREGRPLYFNVGHLNGFGASGVAAMVLDRLDATFAPAAVKQAGQRA